ncbi:MAG: hypothetical protein HUU35_13090, partial [Armatimonadetes bacterium]|nr:hypothetical protein [Armatimonadota bacterium]
MRHLLRTFLIVLAPLSGLSAADTAAPEWVVYSTAVGWLRVGPRPEFEQPWRQSDEIWGGTSAEPLAKALLWAGFGTRDEALTWLLDRVTGLRIENRPLARPYQVIAAQFEGKPYWLRLDRGTDPELALFKGDEYDFEAEWDLLARHGLTPRWDLGPRWLIHATGHGTMNGPVKDDLWLLFGSEPLHERAGEGRFYLPDGYGGTFTYTTDRWFGPYRDNYGLAQAMKQLGIAELPQWPPGHSFTPKIVAARIPTNPRDHGRKALPVQTISDPPELRDWVIYATAGQWLHIGTRHEFEQPVKARETVWGGTGEALVSKEILPLAPRLYSYEHALATLLPALGDLKMGFHPLADPRETVDAVVLG